MGIFGQPIDIDAVCPAFIDQTKSMGNQYTARSNRFADLQFADIAAGFGGDAHLLPVSETERVRICRIDSHRAGPPIFVPGRIAHQGIGIEFHVPSGAKNKWKLVRQPQVFCFGFRIEGFCLCGQLGDMDFYFSRGRADGSHGVIRICPANPQTLRRIQQGLEDAIALINARLESGPGRIRVGQ